MVPGGGGCVFMCGCSGAYVGHVACGGLCVVVVCFVCVVQILYWSICVIHGPIANMHCTWVEVVVCSIMCGGDG